MARLIYRSDSGEDMEHPVGEHSPEVIVGRHKTCAIRTGNNTVSRRHARVSWVDGEYQLVDMNSSNGTFFDGQRVGEHWLTDGDEFACGAFQLRFELEDYERNGAAEDSVVDGLPEEPVFPEPEDSDDGIQFESREPSAPPAEDPFPPPPPDAWSAFREAAQPAPERPKGGLEIPPTQLPFEPPRFPEDASAPDVPAAPEPAVGTEAQFLEFNRQLERKDQLIQDLRELSRSHEDEISRLREENQALQAAVDAHDLSGPSSAEVAALTEENASLVEQNAVLQKQSDEDRERLRTLESQILRIQEGQPTEKELAELREAKVERDRLWEDREELEGKILAFKRQLAGGPAAEDSDAEELARQAADRLHAAEERAQQAEERLHTLEDDLHALENRLDEAQRAAEQATTALDEARDEVARLENQVDELQLRPEADEVQAVREQLAAAERDKQALETDLADLTIERDKLRTERDELRDIAHDRSEIEAAEQSVERLRGQVTLIEEERDEARRLRQELESERNELRTQLDALQTENGELKEILGELPEPGAVRDLERERDEARRERDRLQGDVDRANERVEQLERQLTDERTKAETQQAELVTERDRLQSEVKTLTARVGELDDLLVHSPSKAQLDEMRSRLEDLERERDALSGKIEREAARAREAEDALASARRDGEQSTDALSSLREELDKARAAAKASERALSAASKTVDDKDGQIETLQAQIAKLTSQATELQTRAAAGDRVGTLEESIASLESSVARLEADNASLGDKLREAEKKSTEAAAGAGRLTEMEEELETLTEERDDLLSANKSQVKRISSLLKQVEELKSSSKAGADAGVELQSAKNDLAAALRQADALKQRVSSLETELTEARRSLEGAVDSSELDDAKALARRLMGERDALRDEVAALKKDMAALHERPAPADAAPAGEVQALDEILEDINGRVSDFKNNCETVQFCIEDIRDGREVSDNFAAAMDMLRSNGEQVDAIKQAIRRFKREHLERGGV